MTKLGLIGCGHIHTPGFIRMVGERSDVSFAKVWDHDANRATASAEASSAEVVATPDEIWQDADIDGVVICSETDRHIALVAAGCAAQKNMFVEKPLGFGAADSAKMAAELDAAGVIFQTGYFMRGFSHFRYMRQAINAGHFGQITRIRLSNTHSGSLNDWFSEKWGWMTDPAVAGVGAFGDLGTHILDILLWLIDQPIKQVTGQVDTALARYGEECDEYGEALIQFEDGLLATLAAGWVDVADPIKLVVNGTEGYAHFVDGQLYIKSKHIPGAEALSPVSDLPKALPHAFQLYLDALVSEDPSVVELVTPQEAARRSAVMEAIYLGANGNKWIAID